MKARWIIAACFGICVSLQAETEMETRIFIVPSTLLRLDGGENMKRKLEGSGILFPEGASAIYREEKSALIVKNLPDQLRLVEAYVEQIKSRVEKMLFVAIFELSFQGDLSEVLARAGSNPDFGFHVTIGDKTIQTTDLFDFTEASDLPRQFHEPTYFGSREWMNAEMSRAPNLEPGGEDHRQIKFVDTFSDPQSQLLLRSLKRIPGVGITRMPSLTLVSGQAAMSNLGPRRYGVQAVLGAKEDTIDVALYLPEHGRAHTLEGPTEVTSDVQMAIPDGHMGVVAERKSDGDNRIVFVRSLILDMTEEE